MQRSKFLLVAAMLVSAIAWMSNPATPIVSASDPCATIAGDPHPPIGDPEPFISGEVTDVDTTTPVSGATVRLYRCDSGSSTLVSTTTTSSQGEYSFTSLSGPKWYYVEVLMTGPLSGMQPASGTNNPSLPVDVGPGDSELDFDFE